jgi:hypothetical protein
LSDVDQDYRCLEEYLASGEFGELPDQKMYKAVSSNDPEMRQVYMEVIKKLGLDQKMLDEIMPSSISLPTRFESPTSYQIIDRLVKKIKSVAERIGIDVSDFPYHSSIPTRLVNAQAVKLDGAQKKFLLFDSQLFNYCNLFAKAFAQCLPIKNGANEMISFDLSTDAVNQNLDMHPEVIQRFSELLRVMHKTAVPGYVEPYIPAEQYLGLANLYREGMELFVVAHEFGHVYAKHLGEILSLQSRLMKFGDGLTVEHQQEFEADIIGMILMCHAQIEKGYDPAMAYIGAELFFHALEMENRYSYFLKNGSDAGYTSLSSQSHPSNEARRNSLRGHVSLIIENPEQVSALNSLAKKYEEIVGIVWARIKELPEEASIVDGLCDGQDK